MCYKLLRNVAMHFKAFKCDKNAFYSSVVVTHSSRAPILDIFLFFNLTSDIVKGPQLYDSLLYIKTNCILNFSVLSYKFISLT